MDQITQFLYKYVLSPMNHPVCSDPAIASMRPLQLLQHQSYTCAKLLLSKMLGYAIIAGSALYKLPQIFAILRHGSASGLSVMMYLLELVGFFITLVYNYRSGYPFSTYGENVFMIAQNCAIVLLIFWYGTMPAGNKTAASRPNGFFALVKSLLFAVVFASMFLWLMRAPATTTDGEVKGTAGAAAVATDALSSALNQYVYPRVPVTVLPTVDQAMLSQLQQLTVYLLIAGRLPQIISNYVKGSAGALSGVTCLMQLGGNVARLYTTLQEVDDRSVLISFLTALALNAVLALQVIWYSYLGYGSEFKQQQPAAAAAATTTDKGKGKKPETKKNK